MALRDSGDPMHKWFEHVSAGLIKQIANVSCWPRLFSNSWLGVKLGDLPADAVARYEQGADRLGRLVRGASQLKKKQARNYQREQDKTRIYAWQIGAMFTRIIVGRVQVKIIHGILLSRDCDGKSFHLSIGYRRRGKFGLCAPSHFASVR